MLLLMCAAYAHTLMHLQILIIGLNVVLQLLGDLPSPIPEEPSHLGTAPASPQTPRPHPSAERSLETKAAPFLAAALHQSRLTH